MWLLLQQDHPSDYVIGTGRLHTLKELCEIAYRSVDKDWREYVVSDPALVRPLESWQTLADPSKAQKQLGWQPTISFEEMIKKMVAMQLLRLQQTVLKSN
jgi:GDPmannose 4,6-dehydratase